MTIQQNNMTLPLLIAVQHPDDRFLCIMILQWATLEILLLILVAIFMKQLQTSECAEEEFRNSTTREIFFINSNHKIP